MPQGSLTGSFGEGASGQAVETIGLSLAAIAGGFLQAQKSEAQTYT